MESSVVTFNDFDTPGTRISSEHRNRAKYITQIAYFVNRETTEKIIVHAKTLKVDNNKIRKALFVNLRPLYVTYMHYLEERSGSGCVVRFIVQWFLSKQIRQDKNLLRYLQLNS